VLSQIIELPYFRIFFDPLLRRKKTIEIAKDYGIENEANLDDYFDIEYHQKNIRFKPKSKELLLFNEGNQKLIREQLFHKDKQETLSNDDIYKHTKTILVFRKHKYYDQLNIELFEGEISKEGKIKNPLQNVDTLKKVWETDHIEVAKFYAAVAKYQNNFTVTKTEIELNGLKLIVGNPLELEVFLHDANISENVTANSINQIELKKAPMEVKIHVAKKEPFYEITGELLINDLPIPLKMVEVRYQYFVHHLNILYLISQQSLLNILVFFKFNNPKILIHANKFEAFRKQVLSPLESMVQINYSFIKPATNKQIKEQGFDQSKEKLIYLSDQDNYVSITPVVRYGNVEIPVFTRKQITDIDPNGNEFKVERDNDLEIQFTAVLMRMHPEFEEQLYEAEYFYLHKDKFLNEDWFLHAFDEWRKQNITILGFNEIKNNKRNAYAVKIGIELESGINWFNTKLTLKYDKQVVSMKQLHKSIRTKSKFVQLDDGTLGLLPAEWLKKFERFFMEGELVGEYIHIPKNNFNCIDELFEIDQINDSIKKEISFYKDKLHNHTKIAEVLVPAELKGSLRDYQKQGLNWLNFLDEYNFGACLADDMGLGKTIQILAFLLLQKQKHPGKSNLIVVPTSLLFNWQAEAKKFAPSLNLFTYYGLNRIKNTDEFNTHDIILTTYGMMLSDIRYFKGHHFNYIFLDESQAIKNPESRRYKAARMLHSRNKVILTGTPIENNTYDLFGQLSFACPGLLGSKQNFTDLFAMPIDKFKSGKRARELQEKIQPFVLRRTKKQVAKELPEKTEMVIYCEMGLEQRKVYDLHEKDLRDYLAGKSDDEVAKSSIHVLTGITKLRQICNATSLLKDESVYGNHSAKIEVLMEQIENKSPNHKILVFSQFVSMLDLIKKELETKNIAYEYLTGQTKNREARVNSFQNNAAIRVFLISLKAGGVGLNLTEADYIYLVDPWWNPAVENQAIDRSYRIGQKKNVIAVRLITPCTLEEKIQQLQSSKTDLVNDLIKTDSSILKSISKDNLLQMFQHHT
jgi:SNF2 family DNA or RNA helicase